jgi:FkbM family methyltransferase
MQLNHVLRRIQEYLRIFGYRGALIALKLPNGRARRVKFKPGFLRHPIYFRSPSSDVLVYEQIFTNQEYSCRFLRPPGVILDIGANIGFASIYFANMFPETKILAVEPEYENFKLLLKNTANYPNIRCLHAGVWWREAHLNVKSISSSWDFQASEAISDPSAFDAVGITISKLMEQHAITRADIVKIDIEGAELEVFEHGSEWVSRCDSLIVETHDRFRPGCAKALLNATQEFGLRWQIGENSFVAREAACIREQ